ncbi:glutathione S-transferase [Schizosaccharomyces octosporus yFS286]|uniref:Glutathione S-transferase n=1 Tax=Schizosaccharomyces octosporus (strain yFS286) TaxID=483514 RepID=S9PWS7_SCHOY|nr:glutathione S-transferase [Schizosaccharomyces octosporus yFS286]EPX71923.1 glutathione S-transferase [Schizosaccharomyces octosporus yFS286]
MSLGTLYSFKDNTRTVCLLELAKRLNLQVDLVETYPHKFPSDLAAKFPLQKLPVFISSNGLELSELFAILRYFYEKGKQNDTESLGGKNAKEEAEIWKWISYVNTDVVTPSVIRPWLGMCRGASPYEEKPFKESTAKALGVLKKFNDMLVDRTFLVGNRFTLADLVAGSMLRLFYRFIVDPEQRSKLPHLTRYYVTMFHQGNLSEIIPLELIPSVVVAKN